MDEIGRLAGPWDGSMKKQKKEDRKEKEKIVARLTLNFKSVCSVKRDDTHP